MSPSYPAARDCSRTPTLEIFRTSADACDQCWRLPFCSVCIPDPEFLSFPGVWPSPLLMAAVNFAIGSDFNIEGMASGRLVGTLWLMATLLAVIFVAGLVLLPRLLGKAKSSKSMRELFAKTRSINLLAAARVFIFGARDVCLSSVCPFFSTPMVGAFWKWAAFSRRGPSLTMAFTPSLLRCTPQRRRTEFGDCRGASMGRDPGADTCRARNRNVPLCHTRIDLLLVAGLAMFGLPIAVNSSLHSYLILAYAGSEKTAEDVGFYYGGKRGGAPFGHHPIRRSVSAWRHRRLPQRLRRYASDVLGDHLRFTPDVEHAGSPIGSWRGRGISGWSGFGPVRNAGVKARRRFPSAPAR